MARDTQKEVTAAQDGPGGSAPHTRRSATTDRRGFLAWFIGLGTVTVAGALSVPLVRFALDPLTRTSTETAWNDVGSVDDFKDIGIPQKRTLNITQIDGWRTVMMEKSVYVVRLQNGTLTVFTATCPHLGCSIKWLEQTKQFKCPCHNGIFSPEGKLISGPPPRDLDALDSKIEDGHLKVRYQSFRNLVKTKEVLA